MRVTFELEPAPQLDRCIWAGNAQRGRENDAAQLIDRMKRMPHDDGFVLWGTDWQLYYSRID